MARSRTPAFLRASIAFGVFAFCALATDERVARADSPDSAGASPKPTSSLSWVRLPGAESCLAPAELSTRIEAKLGRAVFVSPSTADLSIEARAEVDPTNKHIRVVVSGTRRDGTAIGTRELGGPDCKSIEDGLVLVLALMIDRDAATAPPSPPPKKEDAPPERIVIHEVVHDAPAPIAPPLPIANPWSLDVLAAFELAAGRTPDVAPGLFVGALMTPPHFVPIEIAFDALPSDHASVGAHDISVTELAADVAACPMWNVSSRVRGGACAGLRIGAFSSSGSGFVSTTDQTALLADAFVIPRAEIAITAPLFVFAGAGISIPFARQRVSFNDATSQNVVVYDRPAIGADFSLGLGLRFLP